jgi:hypothetical protein
MLNPAPVDSRVQRSRILAAAPHRGGAGDDVDDAIHPPITIGGNQLVTAWGGHSSSICSLLPLAFSSLPFRCQVARSPARVTGNSCVRCTITSWPARITRRFSVSGLSRPCVDLVLPSLSFTHQHPVVMCSSRTADEPASTGCVRNSRRCCIAGPCCALGVLPSGPMPVPLDVAQRLKQPAVARSRR